MTTIQHTCFTLRCDGCGAHYDSDGIILHFESAAEVVDSAQGVDWVSLPDGRQVCERCARRMADLGEIEQVPDGAWYEWRLVPQGSES